MKTSDVSTEAKKAYKETMNGSTHAAERIQKMAEATFEDATEKARDLSRKVEQNAERFFDESSETLKRTVSTVKKHPVESALIAIGTGVFLGSIFYLYNKTRQRNLNIRNE